MTSAQAHTTLRVSRRIAYWLRSRHAGSEHPLCTPDDLMGAGALAICERHAGYDASRGGWEGYATMLARKGALEHVRAVLGRSERPRAQAARHAEATAADVHDPAETSCLGADPSAALDAQIDCARLLPRLTALERDALRRFYLHGSSRKQIALDLGVTELAIKKRLASARHKLRRLAGVNPHSPN